MSDTSMSNLYDAVVVGAGVAGALIAKRLTQAGLGVLLLEAGPASAASLEGYAAHLETFHAAASKGPESAWPAAVAAPQPDTADWKKASGYFVQTGPQPYGSSYSRLQGGSTLHWLGVSLRMLPEDFELRSRYGVGVDWPLGYGDLEPYYRAAERELGVSADVADQSHHGIVFETGYDYPMHRIPPSFSDERLAERIDGMQVELGGEPHTVKVRSYPAARNGMPRHGYAPAGAIDMRAGTVDVDQFVGQRCQGNTACTPICPVQAKYNALKTIAEADRGKLRVLTQAVASQIRVDPDSGLVAGIEYQRYEDAGSPTHSVHLARGRLYVLAAHAVENAKLMLASGLGGAGGGSIVGRNLMDHPALYAWGLAPRPIGAFRGPLSTAGIEDLRGGAFRATHAAFRYDIGNDGWRAPTGAPDTTVADAVMTRNLHGTELRASLAATLSRQVRFSIAVEQLPDPGNGVTIDPRYRDPLGNPRPVIGYRVDDYTLAGMEAASRVTHAMFAHAGIEDHTAVVAGAFPSVDYRGRSFQYHGMGHFAGTHRMGADPASSVVDTDQRAWGHRNLFLVGAGSFPTMGTSNPTLTLAALTIRTAERIIAGLTSRSPGTKGG